MIMHRPSLDLSTVQWLPTEHRWVELERFVRDDMTDDDWNATYARLTALAASYKLNDRQRYQFDIQTAELREQESRALQSPWDPVGLQHNNEGPGVHRTVLHDPLKANHNQMHSTYQVPVIRAPQPIGPIGQHTMIAEELDRGRSNTLTHDASAPYPSQLQSPIQQSWNAYTPRPALTRLSSYQGTLQGRSTNLSSLTDDELRASVPLVSHVNEDRSYFTEEKDARENTHVSLKDFWQSGLASKGRQHEYTRRHLSAGGKLDDPEANTTMSIFVPMYENLQWYTTQKSLGTRPAPGQAGKSWLKPQPASSHAVGGKDYFVSHYVEPPEWCIDRSMSLGPVSAGTIGKGVLGGERKVQTFFGELEWVGAPERVGRDARYHNQRVSSWSGSEQGRKTPMKMTGGVVSSATKSGGLGMGLGMGRFG